MQFQETAKQWQQAKAALAKSPGLLRIPARLFGSWTEHLPLVAGWGWGESGFPWHCENRNKKIPEDRIRTPNINPDLLIAETEEENNRATIKIRKPRLHQNSFFLCFASIINVSMLFPAVKHVIQKFSLFN